MSDLFGNHIVGFPMRRLKYLAKSPVSLGLTWIEVITPKSFIYPFLYNGGNQDNTGMLIHHIKLIGLDFEPSHEKTNNLGFPPGLTQTSLHSHRRWLEAGNFRFRKEILYCPCSKTKGADQLRD